MKKHGVLLALMLTAWLLGACANVGPHKVAQDYRNAARAGDQATLVSLHVGKPYTQAAKGEDLAVLHEGEALTVLLFGPTGWRVACSSYGVPAQSDPVRHALLTALSAIERGDWAALDGSMPAEFPRPFAPDASLQADLKDRARRILPHACDPFREQGGAWTLAYDDDPQKRLRIQQQDHRYVIAEWE